ncbi:Cell well associated RhsD protein [Archangium gephyra]|uniref:Cell well associated RhsD protein n=2 Tax=Archangium gephyra TaxID=48 RepID=A0AAC8TJD1_9BACT|nr:Cell well associated RhsD protein [Archangium gephyra]
MWFCTGNDTPEGSATTADDCAPLDATRWRLVEDGTYYTDGDKDGRVSATPAGTCHGPDPAAYTRTPGTDCDDANPSLWQLRDLYPDKDWDGYPGGTAEQRCMGNAPPAGYSETAQDCAPTDPSRNRLMTYTYRDADGDGATVAESGQVCTGSLLPTGYATSAGPRLDCDDTRADRWQTTGLYRDVDGDGVGSGTQEQRCLSGTTEPGYVSSTGDCAPEDKTRWTRVTYSWRDADGDDAWVSEWGELCIAAYSVPPGYSSSWPSSIDCDDTRASVRFWGTFYPDTDGDGFGSGASETLCAGSTRPAGYSTSGTDCAPDDTLRWQNFTYAYRDADGDTFTVASSGALCIGTSFPAGYTNTAHGNDCDDSSADVYQSLQGYLDEDADGVGAGTASTFCTSGSLPTGHASKGTDCAPTDASRWQSLSFQYVDADGDGRTVPASGALCTGSTLPAPYATKATGNDCDDANPALFLWRVLYPDKDGDGVGVPPRVVLCLDDGPVPPGYSIYGFDPDDSTPGVKDPPRSPS